MLDRIKLSFNENKNSWFVVSVVLVFLYLLWGIFYGRNQDEGYRNDYQNISQVRQMVNKVEYTQAEPIMKELIKKYPDSYLVTWQYAVVLDGTNQFQEAKKYYLRTQELRPFIVKNQYFLTQLGRIYFVQGDYINAKKYFLTSRAVNANQELTMIADSTLSEIIKKGY
jgi:tetratricopeptide (TPR) repeat protein